MGNIDEKVEHCPFRHPSSNGEGVCFYSSKTCKYPNNEECEIYVQNGREYVRRFQEYQKAGQGQYEKR
jgi:hypothetical protein